MSEERYSLGEPISVRELTEILYEGQKAFATKEKDPMPPQQAKPSNFAKYANRSAGLVSSAMSAPLKLGSARLPAGIERGIARLDNCRIAEIKEGKNKGALGFYADGIVIQPVSFQGEKIAGICRTSIFTIPLCDVVENVKPGEPGSWEYQWSQKVIPQLRGLLLIAGEELVHSIDPDDTGDPETMIANTKRLCQRLQNEIKPFFRFRTWKGKPQVIAQNRKDSLWYVWTTADDGKTPIEIAEYKGKKRGPYSTQQEAQMKNKNLNSEFVNEQWMGACPPPDEMSEPTEGAGTEDESGSTAAPPPMKGEKNGPPPPPPLKKGAASQKTTPPPPPVAKDEEEAATSPSNNDEGANGSVSAENILGGSNLDDLIAQCEDTNDPQACGDARERLTEIASKVGMSEDDCFNAPSYEAIVEEIKDRIAQQSESAEQPPEEELPPADVAVKQVYNYRVPGVRKPVQVMVTAVSKKDNMVNLLSLADNKTTFKRVPISQLEGLGG